MVLHGCWQVMLGGGLGVVLLELVKIAAWRDRAEISKRYRRLLYWIGTLALVIVGGVVAVLHGCDNVSAITAAQLGVGAPFLVGSWASARSAAARRRRQFAPAAEEAGKPPLLELLSW